MQKCLLGGKWSVSYQDHERALNRRPSAANAEIC